MSEQAPPPEAEDLEAIRQEASQLLGEILHAAGVPREQCRIILARLTPLAAPESTAGLAGEGYNSREHGQHVTP